MSWSGGRRAPALRHDGGESAVSKRHLFRVPDGIDDATAAALPNPALSAWLAILWRSQLIAGESVLILGATGVTGKFAVQLAKLHGAARVVAVGRNKQVIQTLPELGADSVISLDKLDGELKNAFLAETKQKPFDIVLDYLWGQPAEVLLDALTGHDMTAEAHRTRYIQIGEMAGLTISLAAGTLRSTAIEMVGQGSGSVPKEVMAKISTEILPQILKLATQGKLRIDTEQVPLRDVEQAWQRTDLHGKRIVIIP